MWCNWLCREAARPASSSVNMPTLSKLELFRLYIRATDLQGGDAAMRLKKVESHHGVKYTWNIVPVRANTIPLTGLKASSFTLWNIGGSVVTQSFVWQTRYIGSDLPPPSCSLLGAGQELDLRPVSVWGGERWEVWWRAPSSPHSTELSE